MEIDLAHPVAVMAVAVDEARQNGFAFGVDHLGAFGRLHFPALAGVADAPVLKDHDRVGHGRPPGAVDQRSAQDDDRPALRPGGRGERRHDETQD